MNAYTYIQCAYVRSMLYFELIKCMMFGCFFLSFFSFSLFSSNVNDILPLCFAVWPIIQVDSVYYIAMQCVISICCVVHYHSFPCLFFHGKLKLVSLNFHRVVINGNEFKLICFFLLHWIGFFLLHWIGCIESDCILLNWFGCITELIRRKKMNE